MYTSFGFTSLETLLEGTIPQNAVSVLWFLFVAYITTKWRKTRFCCMMLSVVPAFIGMLCREFWIGFTRPVADFVLSQSRCCPRLPPTSGPSMDFT